MTKNETCILCRKPIYEGDHTTRCLCDGAALRDEIEQLREALSHEKRLRMELARQLSTRTVLECRARVASVEVLQ